MTHRERKSHKKALKAKAVAASTPGFPSDTEERKAGLQHGVTTSQLAEPQVWGELCATFSTGVLMCYPRSRSEAVLSSSAPGAESRPARLPAAAPGSAER